MLLSTAELTAEVVRKLSVEHLELLALPNLDSDSQDSVFYRVETLYNTFLSVR